MLLGALAFSLTVLHPLLISEMSVKAQKAAKNETDAEEERSSSRVMTADPRAVCVYLFMCACLCRESFKRVVYKKIQSSFIFLRFFFLIPNLYDSQDEHF